MHSALSRGVTHPDGILLSYPRVGIGFYIPQRADYGIAACRQNGARKRVGRADEIELPSMRYPHANEHDNRRKVMSDRMA